MNSKLKELVQYLLTGTQAGALNWTETAENGLYRLFLDKGLVRIYGRGPRSAGDGFVGCTVLNPEGIVLHEVEVLRRDGGALATLYDLVDGTHQEGALDELLAEVRMRTQDSGRSATAGKR